jgi:hypothetical protein
MGMRRLLAVAAAVLEVAVRTALEVAFLGSCDGVAI